MSGRKIKLERKKEITVGTGVNVESIEVPGVGIRMIVNFSFDLPLGTNNFNKMVEHIDQEIMESREEVIKKVANKLKVGVNFVD